MIQPLIRRRRSRRLGLAAALIVAAASAPAAADAATHYRPNCQRGAVCLYQNAKWNNDPVLKRTDRGQQLDFLVASHGPVAEVTRSFILNPNRGHPYLPPDRARIPGRSLVNRVSSYANFSKSPYCAYDLTRNGEPKLLWRMPAGSSSSFVGTKRNDRADTIAYCGTVRVVPG
jgi:hypothetical protein